MKRKTAIITGVGRLKGIGYAIAKSFAEKHIDLFITYHAKYDGSLPEIDYNPNDPEQIYHTLKEKTNIFAKDIDLSKKDSAKYLFDIAEKQLGKIDILVNNAVHDKSSDIYSVDSDTLDKHYTINLKAPILLCKEFITRFNATSGGRIINLTSGQSITPMPNDIEYIATKGAIEAFTKSFSITAGKKGITINTVDPGATDTGWMPDELYQNLKKQSPFGRVGEPEDVANLISFLASDEAKWITGQIIHSRGGIY